MIVPWGGCRAGTGGTDIIRKSEHNTGRGLGKKEKKNMTFIYPAVLTPHKEDEATT